ncbi:unnamed protein product [Rhizophagus irregularis]|nr:unnamed protein product [Rhizophagus irregularis]
MNHNKYDGTIHPEVWIRQIRLSFYDQNNENTKNEQETVDYCKLLIHPSIKISSETNSFVGLVNDLKLDASYDAFKKSIKKKVQELKFNNIINKDDGDDESLKFLNNFKQLCYEGEITEIGERKRLFLTALSKGSLQHFLIDNKFDKINSMEELFKYFYESLLDEPKTVKNVVPITMKMVVEIWFMQVQPFQIQVVGNSESPATKNSKVYGDKPVFYITPWHFRSTNSENPPYVKSKDIINLQSDQFVLRSSESTFTNRSITYQEVACHKERIGGNDEWCIEIIEQSN